jgi:ATP-dependent helicase/nuclease subunit A
MNTRPACDHRDFEAAVRIRERNVLVDAGAGTGKTTALVRRLAHLVAPETSRQDAPIPLHRLAAITFTRRAAGELRFRVRQELLAASASETSASRRKLLGDALASLDAAFIGTIHSFCDRLMRLRPVEMGLSPGYEILENTSELLKETLDLLLRSLEEETLKPVDAAQALQTYLETGQRVWSRPFRYEDNAGTLASFVKNVIDTRDVSPVLYNIPKPDLEEIRKEVQQILGELSYLNGASPGHQDLRRLAEGLRDVQKALDVRATSQVLLALKHLKKPNRLPKSHFGGDLKAYEIASRWGRTYSNAPRIYPEKLLRPFLDGLAVSFLQAREAFLAAYEAVKRRRAAVDPLDLLLKFRDALRDRPELRTFYAGLFDHLMVDEFQDTDPLQIEILFYLCDAEPQKAKPWDRVRLRPGSLMVVGDPQQSIYHFRRADLRTYFAARELLIRQGAEVCTLSANFRSRPELVKALNVGFARLLSPDGESPVEGEGRLAPHQVLHPVVPPARRSCVVGLGYRPTGRGTRKEDYLSREAEMTARYLRWIVESRSVLVRDRTDGGERPAGYADMAVLARVTSHLPTLLSQFRRFGVPYSARGGTLFLEDRHVRLFILALRAIADPGDGPAQAAFFRPPFFPIDPSDLLAADAGEDSPGARRARKARELLEELRRRRTVRAPSATALDFLERSAFERTVALRPNAAQILSMIREIVLEIDLLSARDGLDFDGATAVLREWIDRPVQLDPPDPGESPAVRVLTVHQAKGLEFPIVALWDGEDPLDERRGGSPAWTVSRDGRAWSLRIGDFEASLPQGTDIRRQEESYLRQERRRLYYVACTRARDLLILPLPEKRIGAAVEIARSLQEGGIVKYFYDPFGNVSWAKGIDPVSPVPLDVQGDAFDEARERSRSEWEAAWKEWVEGIAAEETAPVGEEEGGDARRTAKHARARFGRSFGIVVHAVLDAILGGSDSPVELLVDAALAREGGTDRRREVLADVERARAALERFGILRKGICLRTEYPVYQRTARGRILVGYVDCVALGPDEGWILDFKTDAPREGGVLAAYPEYVRQLRQYERMLRAAGVLGGRNVRLGLLLTATGEVLEVPAARPVVERGERSEAG